MIDKLKLKTKRATEKTHAHTKVYAGDTYLGYIMQNDSPHVSKMENWNFDTELLTMPSFYDKTRKGLIQRIKNFYNAIELQSKLGHTDITLHQAFRSAKRNVCPESVSTSECTSNCEECWATRSKLEIEEEYAKGLIDIEHSERLQRTKITIPN